MCLALLNTVQRELTELAHVPMAQYGAVQSCTWHLYGRHETNAAFFRNPGDSSARKHDKLLELNKLRLFAPSYR